MPDGSATVWTEAILTTRQGALRLRHSPSGPYRWRQVAESNGVPDSEVRLFEDLLDHS